MLTSPDFKGLLSLLEKHKVRYLVVGGYAVLLSLIVMPWVFGFSLKVFCSTQSK
jgi:hypothetical protein